MSVANGNIKQQLLDFKHKVDIKFPALTARFRGKRLSFFRMLLKDLEQDALAGISVDAYVNAIYDTLAEGHRFLDIAVLYTQLHAKKQTANNSPLPALFKKSVLLNIRSLFTQTLTYHFAELDAMFVDILQHDREYFFHLVSFVFEKYDLVKISLSENMWQVFIDIAHEDFSRFVTHSGKQLLAFYLNAIPRLPFVPPEHIAQIRSFLLATETPANMISKILDSLKINPSPEILMILILRQRQRERARAIVLLHQAVKDSCHSIRSDDLNYFLSKVMEGHLFNFHAMPEQHKTLLFDIIRECDLKEAIPSVTQIIWSKDSDDDDPKVLESKKLAASLLVHMALFDKDARSIVHKIEHDPTIDPRIKRVVSRFSKAHDTYRR